MFIQKMDSKYSLNEATGFEYFPGTYHLTWDAILRLHFLMTLCSPGAIHIQEKAISGPHKARKGLRKMLWLHSVSPCCFSRNMCDLKDKVVTEGKAGIFNDLPRAHGQSSSLISHY